MIVRVSLVLILLLTQVSSPHAAEGIPIGCILPLSGKFASFGNKVLQGIELAIERHNSSEAGKKYPARLFIKDSQGLPDMAAMAVREFDKEGINVIIGPILGVDADSAARTAQQLSIPIITMTQKEGIADTGDWVFRNCITNAAQVRGLVEYAYGEGIRRIAVLYPDNQYGREINSLFAAEMSRTGGEIAASQSYKDWQTDFGPEIKALARPDFLKKMKIYAEERGRRFKEAERSGISPDEVEESDLEKPRPDFDAVFIPDYHERVGLIVPQLAFYDITGVKLLGISGWNSPNLIKLAGRFLEDAVFVDGFFSGSRRPDVKEFVELYQNTFGEEPGILEAQAFDTAGIVLSVAAEGTGSREGMRIGISRIKDYKGISGEITFNGRDAERSLYFLTVKGGRIEEIEAP